MAHQRHLPPTFGHAFGIPAPVVSPSENDILIRKPSRECLYLAVPDLGPKRRKVRFL